jgi:hypothetical protein
LSGVNVHSTSQPAGSVAHRRQSKSIRAGLGLFDCEPVSIVLDHQHDRAWAVAQQDGDATGAGMLSDVAQGFLRDTIQLILNFFGQLVWPSADVERALNSAVTRKTLGELAKRVGQMRAFEWLWPQTEEHSARVLQTGFGQVPDACQALGEIQRFDRAVDCLEVQQNSSELLNERVMDFASQPVALLYDGEVRQSFDETLIARLRNKTPGGAVEILEPLIHFTDSHHREFPLLPM